MATYQGIGRGARRVAGNGIEVKVEIQDSVTTRIVEFRTYVGHTLDDITKQVQKDIDQMATAEQDQALSAAVVGVLLAASNVPDAQPTDDTSASGGDAPPQNP